MATVPSQSTAAVGNLVSSTLWNDDVRDAVNFLLDPPRTRLRNTATVSTNTSTYTAMTWDTEVEDTDGMHSTSTNTSRITIVTTGYYQLSGGIGWAANSTGQRRAWWHVNGTGVLGGLVTIPAGTATEMAIPAATITLSLTAGDYVELFGWQNSGGTLDMNPTTSFGSYAEARLVAV